MKIILSSFGCLIVAAGFSQVTFTFNDTAYLQPIEVTAIRANEKSPFAKTTLQRKDIVKINLGQDLPFLLNQTPSVVINSDAGNGVGYTGIRIRGADATRINLTLNGIPYNDAESQGTFFVNLPDFASSANSIQVQRGVGTSTNGAGAFGASINISTNEINDSGYIEVNNSFGSYNTWKNTLRYGSGIFGKHFIVEGRLSNITSDGYIDRATTRLRSYYFSTAYVDDKSSLRINIFSGKEKTYQAWYGVPESLLATNRTYNAAGTERPGTAYENETDNYLQTHYQLFYNRKINNAWKAGIAIFLTKGAGYYEQYKAGAPLADYGLPDYNGGNTVTTATDIVRQLWLKNNFYGTTFSLQHQKNNTQVTIGGGWNKYDGNHFGEITWAAVQAAVPYNYRWYNLDATKQDFSFYTKWTQQLNKHWQSFIDLQYRNVQYDINGFRNNPGLKIKNSYSFFNPKVGLTYTNKKWQAYASYGIGAKEPNRDDFEAGIAKQPKSEKLQDIEIGLDRKSNRFAYGANLFYMNYKDQLVLTGEINDVGAYTRTNIASSYRAGVEMQGSVVINKWLNAIANISLSRNQINDYTEYVDDYDNGGQKTTIYKKSTIAFSPAVTGAISINFIPLKNAEISLLGKYVSRQHLDNTSQQSRSLNPYYVQDIRFAYTITSKIIKNVSLILLLNNVLNKKYEANAYTFSYISGGMKTENFYYPMAPFNCMAGINIRF